MIAPETAKLTFEKAGVQFEGVPLERRVVENIESPSGQKVDLGCAIWRRKNDEAFLQHEAENEAYNKQHPTVEITDQHGEKQKIEVRSSSQRENQVVFVSGFASSELELPTFFHSLGKIWGIVVGLAHPDAPSSKIKPPDKPLNENSFANSGFVELRAIERLIQDGVLEKNATVVAYSTGCPVMIEAVAQDIQEHSNPEDRLIKNLVLLAPGGMLDRGSFAAITEGAGASMRLYWEEYKRDFWHFIRNPYHGKDEHPYQPISLKQLAKNVLESIQNPDWKTIRPGQIAFEVIEFVASHLPIHDFLAWFHRTWSNPREFNLPNILPPSPSIKKNQELIYKDSCYVAREKIKDTDIIVSLFTDDKAIPPEGFLTDKDNSELAQIENPDERLELTSDRIIQRVKEKFPHDQNRVRVIIGDGAHHITPKVDLDVVMQILANKVK